MNDSDNAKSEGADDAGPDELGSQPGTAGGEDLERSRGSEAPAAHADAAYDGESDAPMSDQDDDD